MSLKNKFKVRKMIRNSRINSKRYAVRFAKSITMRRESLWFWHVATHFANCAYLRFIQNRVIYNALLAEEISLECIILLRTSQLILI